MSLVRAMAILLLTTGPSNIRDQEIYSLHERVLRFEEAYDSFLRRLYACPGDKRVTISPESCRPGLGTIDYRLYARARERAKDLFGLDDPCPRSGKND